MGEKLGEALLDLNTSDKQFNDGVDRAEKKATGLGRVFDNVGQRAMAVGRAMAAGAAIGGAAFGAALFAATKRLEEMRRGIAQTDKALANSGNTARTSGQEIWDWAQILEERTGRAAEEVIAVSSNLASFGFGREQFYRAIQLADDMAAAWGGDLRQNIEGLSRALDDPINGMAMLSKRGIKLTDEQKALAQAFVNAGDKVSAQGVVFEALEAQVKGVAQAGFGGLTAALSRAQNRWENAFEDLVSGTGDAGDLRDTLVQLADTLSSPEFIASAMGFGQKLVQGIDLAAKAVIFLWGKTKEFLDWLDGQNRTKSPNDFLSGQQQANGEVTLFKPLDFGTLFSPQPTPRNPAIDNTPGSLPVPIYNPAYPDLPVPAAQNVGPRPPAKPAAPLTQGQMAFRAADYASLQPPPKPVIQPVPPPVADTRATDQEKSAVDALIESLQFEQ